jgi:thiosulfate dehydrogenase (quinone) large subunit
MSAAAQVSKKNQVQISDPPIAQFLFADVRMSWLWLILRLYVGYEWFMAGWGKFTSPVWFGDKAGVALTGFINGALAKTAGDHPDVQGWYAGFLQSSVLPNAALWSRFVVIGEILVGVALILGIFTGLAAFFGGFMNVNYLMAGTVSTNPLLFVIATWLVLSWKTAGWLGLDRWVLPRLGKFLSPRKTTSPS